MTTNARHQKSSSAANRMAGRVPGSPNESTAPAACHQGLSFRQIQAIVGDLKQPNPKIYWIDFLATIFAGHALFHILAYTGRWWPEDAATAWTVRLLTYPLVVVLYMRAAMFIHELVHLPREGFRFFRVAWNVLCGIFFLIPSFMYYPHIDHHRRSAYGTHEDGEYLPLAHRPAWYIVGMILQSFLIPVLGMVRFLVLSPICWLVPSARRWVHRHASTMVVDPFYHRPDATKEEKRIVILQEVGCFLWCSVFVGRGLFYFGDWKNPLWMTGYAVGVGVVLLNSVRTLGAHRWTGEGEPMDFTEQLLDTLNYPHRPWITEIWGPVGTRYHALHHLLPSLPYHHMPEAHRRLMAQLPKDSPYRQTERTSLLAEIRNLYRAAAASQAAGQATRSMTGG